MSTADTRCGTRHDSPSTDIQPAFQYALRRRLREAEVKPGPHAAADQLRCQQMETLVAGVSPSLRIGNEDGGEQPENAIQAQAIPPGKRFHWAS